MDLNYYGTDVITDRRLFSLNLGKPSDLAQALQLNSKRFVCLLAWDTTDISSDDVGAFVATLLEQGAVYFCCWGPGCERTHDIIDEEIHSKGIDENNESVIMTTWHDNEELTEAIEFSLLSAIPDEDYSLGCNAALAISIGSLNWAAQTELYLAKYMLKNAI